MELQLLTQTDPLILAAIASMCASFVISIFQLGRSLNKVRKQR